MVEKRDDMNAPESTYWRSLKELYDGKSVSETKAHEFMSGVTDDFRIDDLGTMSRKQFLALLSASAAFAAAGCNAYRDKGDIVPYTKKPEEVTPGIADYYASTCTGCSNSCGVLVKTREGRPIKVDGNPDHPVNRGAVCPRGQASVLNLYDPSRLRSPEHGSTSGKRGAMSWETVDSEIRKRLRECVGEGKEIALLTNTLTSPTTTKLLAEFGAMFPTTRRYSYELFNDSTRRAAWESCYGTSAPPVIAWEKASVIVLLEADILGTEGNTLEQIRKFAAGRDIMTGDRFNRMYAVEGSVSLTGTNADYRLRLRPDGQLDFVLGLLNEICFVRGEARMDPEILQVASTVSLHALEKNYGLPLTVLTRLVDDLLIHRGTSIVYAGDTLSESLHVAVNYLNEILGNTELYVPGQTLLSHASLSTPAEIQALVARMKEGRVGMVIHCGTNPVYHLPPSVGYREALRSVPTSVSFADAEDETGQWCTYLLPVSHTFESWGDHSVRSGILSLQQPMISPLHGSRQVEAALLTWMSPEGSYSETVYHDYLVNRWEKEVYPRFRSRSDFSAFWLSALHDGVLEEREAEQSGRRFATAALAGVGHSGVAPQFAAGLRPNSYLGDGRYANNGWLQELPHPVSKIVWDNYAALSPATAAELGVQTSDMIEVSVGSAKQTIPVYVQPGQADRFVSIELGYGRTNAGPIGSGVGTDANILLSPASLTGARVFRDVRVKKVSGRYELVSTQEHHGLDTGPLDLKDLGTKRGIIREGTLAAYQEDPEFMVKEHKRPELFSIAKEVEYKGVKWAMAIDMNKCVGCNACVAGCNVENNVPVVGKDQVGRGREMQWIRLDRYFSGSAADPTFTHQPMLCQHCDQAPCENVCPVSATNHSPDGLNQMAYNRCVGTKYCSNNCPYKVRRFNFYNFRDFFADAYYEQDTLALLHNPEVTVRSRGVMEKCTFCVQRIMEARQHAVEQGRPVKGTDVRTACQEACPAQAIVFGDMNDPESEISRYRKHSLGYYVLEDLNVRPNVTYVAKLRNIHTEKVS